MQSASFVIGDDSSTEATISTNHTLRLKSGSGISATVSPTDDSISIAISLVAFQMLVQILINF